MREGVILVATSAKAAEHYRQLISRRWEPIEKSRVFTTNQSPAMFEGLHAVRVYLTPEATREMPDEIRYTLIKLLARSKNREGFFVVMEDGDIYGGFDNVVS
jgi:hypothetical protein